MMRSLEIMKRHYHDRLGAARSWKEEGGKVVGYISGNVPEEMIIAAGLFPLRISGDPREATDVADRTMEPFFDPSVRSMYNMLLTGKYDFLDLLIIPHCNDSVFKLYYYLQEAKRLDPSLSLPECYLFDMLYTAWFTTRLYNRERIQALRQKLECLSGKAISEYDLRGALSLVNESRFLLRRVSELRKKRPPRISGAEALQIIGSSMFIHKKEHNRLLREFLEEADQLLPRNRIRLSVEGSEVDNLQFYDLIESCGATIVTETHSWGNRYFEDPVDTSMAPLEAINEKYHMKSPCPQVYPKQAADSYGLKTAREFDVHGVIFFILEWDDMPGWEYPEEKAALEKAGIPTLCFRNQKYLLSDEGGLRKRIWEFIRSIDGV